MIPREQVDSFLSKQPKINVSKTNLESFSAPYQNLGLILLNKRKSEKQTSVESFVEHFGKDHNFNPWDSEEGKKLALLLFGEIRAPYISDIWNLMNQLPFQSGYYRRPFRLPVSDSHTSLKLQILSSFYNTGDSGIAKLSIKEQIQYSSYFPYQEFGIFLAAVLEKHQNEYFPLLQEIILGEDEIGGVSREIIKGLMISENPENHLLVEKLLIAAQLQEGLRQTILETLDFTSIVALKRFIKVILDNNLSRFSSVVRAVDTWFGFGWEAPKTATVKRILELADLYLNDQSLVADALKSKDNLEVYVALWSKGIYNVEEANVLAFDLFFDEKTDKIKRLVCMFFVNETKRTRTEIVEYAEKHLGEDIEIDYWMLNNFPNFELSDSLFEKMKACADSLPNDGKTFEERGFSWVKYTIRPSFFYEKILDNAKENQLIELSHDLSKISSDVREKFMRKIFPNHYTYSWYYGNSNKDKTADIVLEENSWKRSVARQAISDRNASVAATGITLFKKMELFDEDFEILENLLSRKGKDLRKASIEILVTQSDAQVQKSIQKLVSSANVDQRLAGLEMLTILDESERLESFVSDQIETYKLRKLSKNEQVFIDKLSKVTTEYNYLNGFGAINYEHLTPLVLPTERFKRPKKLFGLIPTSGFLFKDLIKVEKTVKEVNKLIDIFEQNKNYEYQYEGYQGEIETTILNNRLQYTKKITEDDTDEERLDKLPLSELWKDWYHKSKLNDFEMFTIAHFCRLHYDERVKNPKLFDFKQNYLPKFEGLNFDRGNYFWNSRTRKIVEIIEHLTEAYADKKMLLSYKLDVFEDVIYHFPEECKTIKYNDGSYYSKTHWTSIISSLTYYINEQETNQLDLEQKLRLWNLQRYILAQEIAQPEKIEKIQDVVPYLAKVLHPDNRHDLESPYPTLTLTLFNEGKIGKDDMLFLSLLNKDFFYLLDDGQNYYTKRLENFEIPKLNETLKKNLLQVELERGELPTEASVYIKNMSKINGMQYFFEVLQRMGKDNFDRGYSYGTDVSKKYTFSRILKLCEASDVDTYNQFAKELSENKFDKKRLIETSCYATQWADWIGDYLKIKSLKEAVWWFLAHTTDYMNAEKETIISRYSNVPKNDFQQGAIDIEWFHRVYSNLGKTNWKLVHEAAKYLSDGMGYRRVKIYSSVMLGEIKITETLAKVTEKRDKDYVMALGLVPISKANPEADLLKRYNLLQTFLKESKQFGAQRRESEKNAVEIGLDNLARNAGYEDSIRFSWAMEGKATQKIMENSLLSLDEETTIELKIDEEGKADLFVSKNGKEQKSIPAKFKKDKRLDDLKEGKTYLNKQFSRTKQSLENAMLRRDSFSMHELSKIMEHPIVKAMLSKLVLINLKNNDSGFWKDGQIINLDGKAIKIKEDDAFVIAHSVHLYDAVQWDLYQKYVFDNEIVQPFKQIFREIYVPTKDEIEHSNRSERYQGHQIQPNKTVALLRGRGWTVNYEEGLQKVFHKEGIWVTLYAMADWYSPSDVEAPTLEYVCFHSLDDNKIVPLTEIDPVIFSEVMRDVDLVVSVAHVGGVDPEVSHSSMQMRGVLARESARLFKLDNIEVKERHILIKGKLGEYSIHLGSGLVSRNGLQLSIISVHSQHRGRMFLPFVDDDPKSAEIITKMRFLAQDDKIKDPTILAQINK